MFRFLVVTSIFSSFLFFNSPSFASDRLSVISPWISKLSKYCVVALKVSPTLIPGDFDPSYSDDWAVLKHHSIFRVISVHRFFYLYYNSSSKLWEVDFGEGDYPAYESSGSTPLEAFNSFINKIFIAQNARYLVVKASLIQFYPDIDIRVIFSPNEFAYLRLLRVYSNIKIHVNQRSRLPVHSGRTKVNFKCPTLPKQD